MYIIDIYRKFLKMDHKYIFVYSECLPQIDQRCIFWMAKKCIFEMAEKYTLQMFIK